MGVRGWECGCGTVNIDGVEKCRVCRKTKIKGGDNKHHAIAVRACLACAAAIELKETKACPACGSDNIGRFDSTGECRRWRQLRLLEREGHIADLKRQVPFPIEVNGAEVGKYIADFVYMKDGEEVIEDFKGQDVALGRFKRKCVEALYGVTIQLTGSNNSWRKNKRHNRRALSKPQPSR